MSNVSAFESILLRKKELIFLQSLENNFLLFYFRIAFFTEVLVISVELFKVLVVNQTLFKTSLSLYLCQNKEFIGSLLSSKRSEINSLIFEHLLTPKCISYLCHKIILNVYSLTCCPAFQTLDPIHCFNPNINID